MKKAQAQKILVVDDEPSISDLIATSLRFVGFDVQTASNGSQALTVAEEFRPDALVLDVMMPGMDGIEVLRELRKKSDVPVLMLTALGEESDRIVGLEIGADDYLPKTFSSRELLARLRAVIRRGLRAPEPSATTDLVAGNLRLNVASHVALLDDVALELTALEFAILVSLMKAKGRVKTREALIEEVSERRFDVFDRSIDVHISSLRKKLLDDPREPKFIRTVRGVGYTLGEPLTGDAR